MSQYHDRVININECIAYTVARGSGYPRVGSTTDGSGPTIDGSGPTTDGSGQVQRLMGRVGSND